MMRRFLWLVFMIPLLATYSQSFRENLKSELESKNNKKEYLTSLISKEESKIKLSVLENELGLIYQKEGNLDSAKFYHTKALGSAFEYSSNNEEIAISYNKIGIIYFYYGSYDSAIYYLNQAIPFFVDKSLKANTFNNIALASKYNGNPDIAIENYLQALDIFKEAKNPTKEVVILNNIGTLYFDLKEKPKAREYLTKGLAKAIENEDKLGEMTSKSNLANFYKEEGKFNDAIDYLLESISYYKLISDYSNVIANKNNLAICYGETGQISKELNTYQEVLDIMHQTGYSKMEDAILVNIAAVYNGKNEPKKAVEYLNRALNITNRTSNNLETIYKDLSEAYKSIGVLDSSLYFKDLQIALRDSLDKVEKEKKMMELESAYQNKELINNLESTQNELSETEQQKAFFSKGLIVAIFSLIFAILLTLIIYNRYKKKKILSEELSEKNIQNKEDIQGLKSTLGSKDKEIEQLSHLEKTGKLPFPNNLTTLTEREKEVLIGVQEGLKDQEIADKLFISIATVRTHLRKAYVKIDVRNRAEAIQFISKFEI